MAARRIGRRLFSALSITRASAKPSTSSTATVMTVISAVTPKDCHHSASVSTTQ